MKQAKYPEHTFNFYYKNFSSKKMYTEIKKLAKTVNSRIRNNRKKGYNYIYGNWYRLSGGKQLLQDKETSTKSGFLRETYAKKKGESDNNYKKRLTRVLINYIQAYNSEFNYNKIEEYLQEWIDRIGAKDVNELKKVLDFADSNDIMSDLWAVYGSEIIQIINNRTSRGETYEEIMYDLEKLIMKYDTDYENIMNEFSNYGEHLV